MGQTSEHEHPRHNKQQKARTRMLKFLTLLGAVIGGALGLAIWFAELRPTFTGLILEQELLGSIGSLIVGAAGGMAAIGGLVAFLEKKATRW